MKPREKAKEYGLFTLDDSEILALILETGNKNLDVLTLSDKLIKKYGNLENILLKEEGRVSFQGVGEIKQLRLKTCLEIYRRYSLFSISKINNSYECFLLTKSYFYKRKQESLLIFILNLNNEVVEVFRYDSIFKDHIVIENVFIKKLKKYKNHKIIFVHNHPSNVLKPSIADINTYKNVENICKNLKIELFDFLIVSPTDWLSIKE